MSDRHSETGRAHTERIYVEVTVRFDSTGSMQPVTVTWSDGRTFPIKKVRDFRPAGLMERSAGGLFYCFDSREGGLMTSDQRMDLNISNCPKCSTQLMCRKIIVTGYHQCPKCRRRWVIEMERNKVTVTQAGFYFEDLG